ncbi:DUF5819 family protein [Fervidibacillus albus]|uniref:DUF5819 family protein n=1 Tax=Fervidibacillus albus TaxID=2980026 RepID=A0A9E8LSP1_9BACI|nr:DUF5819 family protein [Fervidibacillus albus]WAA08797.1 DUF5819 family protein [Fervidibacillus albus]
MEKKINVTLIILLFLFTVFHFSIILISTGPLNPVSLKIKNFTDSYKTPLLYQSWNLFAPDPVSHTDSIAIKLKTVNGEESDWFDVGKPLLDSNRENSFSPFNRAARLPTGLIQNLYEQDEILKKYTEKVKEEGNLTNHIIDEETLNKINNNHLDILYRFSFSMASLVERSELIEQVKVRLVNELPIPFSKRKDKSYEPETMFIEFDWRDYEKVSSFRSNDYF